MKVTQKATSVYATALWVEEFDSLAEVLDYAMANTKPRSSNRDDGSFSLTSSLADAHTLGHKGYEEIRPDVERMFTQMESQLAERLECAFQSRYDYQGVQVDVGRFLSGEPECMIDFVPEPSARMGRVVRILVNGVASASVDTDRIIKRGVAICALVDSVHKLGMGVEVYVETPINDEGLNDRDGKVMTMLTKLHDSQQMLDINNLMFALCHPSMLRRIMFSVMERTACAYVKPLVGSGYGYPSALECTERVGADVTVEMLQSGRQDYEHNPVDWVMSTLSGLGVV